ncbi:MAG: MarR family transcriptional regulator [Planctomycetota bacterium]|nr:MAG: MarR family transcriptional regulator [Planctomycetota bacterium]
MTTPPDEPESKPPHFDSLEQEAFLNLWRTYDRLHVLEEDLFGRYRLTPQQYNALRLLRGEGEGKLATLALASRLVSRAPDITRLLDKLEQRGLIVRERPADNRRMVLIGLTDKGRDLLASLDEQVRACHARQLGHLDKEKLRALISLLKSARSPHEESGSHWLPTV